MASGTGGSRSGRLFWRWRALEREGLHQCLNHSGMPSLPTHSSTKSCAQLCRRLCWKSVEEASDCPFAVRTHVAQAERAAEGMDGLTTGRTNHRTSEETATPTQSL